MPKPWAPCPALLLWVLVAGLPFAACTANDSKGDGSTPGGVSRDTDAEPDLATDAGPTEGTPRAHDADGPAPLQDTGGPAPDVAGQDTDEPAPDVAGQGPPPTSSVYPPILVTINVHGHNYGYGPQQAIQPNWMAKKLDRYQSDKAEILWIAELAESVDARVNFQLNGEYCRDARLLDGDDTQHIRDLDLAGHVMGSHFHAYQLTDANEYWESVPKSAATEEVLQAIWDAQLGECEEALEHAVYRIDPALDSSVADVAAFVHEHKLDYGVAVEPAGEVFSYAHWNHKPWNPFRKKPGTKLTEDHTHPVLSVMSVPQTGQLKPQGKHQIMTSVPQIQRQFMMLLAEWRERERTGDSRRLWTFGIMTHPSANAAHREDMETIVAWLKAWTEATSEQGNAVAKFSTDADIVARYEAWENKNPGASSFNYDWEAHLAGDISPYPYWVEGATMGLKDCDYVGEIDQGADVQAYEFANREVLRSPANDEGISVMNIGDLRLPVYMLWSHGGPSSVADLSGSVTGIVFVRDGLTGDVTTADSSQITVPVHPVIVCETDDYWP